MKPELGHTRDVYGFAILADELLEKLNNLGKVFTAISMAESPT